MGVLYRENECGNLGEVVGAVIPGNSVWKPGCGSWGCHTGKLSVEIWEQYWGLTYRETECGNLGAVVGAVIPGK